MLYFSEIGPLSNGTTWDVHGRLLAQTPEDQLEISNIEQKIILATVETEQGQLTERVVHGLR